MTNNFPTESAGRRIANDLRRRIQSGELAEGAKLPSSSELASEHAVSSTVVRDAMNTLKSEGVIVSQAGKGRFVAPAGARSAGPAEHGELDCTERFAELEARVKALEEASTK